MALINSASRRVAPRFARVIDSTKPMCAQNFGVAVMRTHIDRHSADLTRSKVARTYYPKRCCNLPCRRPCHTRRRCGRRPQAYCPAA